MNKSKQNILFSLKCWIEKLLPMSLMSFILLVVVLYLFYVVGRSVWSNYQSNLDLEKQAEKIAVMEEENEYLRYLINYYKTDSFKEKEARAKLGYKAAGEIVVALPVDKEEEKTPDSPEQEAEVRDPNYLLWWEYFFG